MSAVQLATILHQFQLGLLTLGHNEEELVVKNIKGSLDTWPGPKVHLDKQLTSGKAWKKKNTSKYQRGQLCVPENPPLGVRTSNCGA